MPGLEQYMAEQQMGAPAPSGPMSIESSNMLQPEMGSGSAEGMRTPLNDRVYSGGQMTQFWKKLLLERAQARAAASAQYQAGIIRQNQESM